MWPFPSSPCAASSASRAAATTPGRSARHPSRPRWYHQGRRRAGRWRRRRRPTMTCASSWTPSPREGCGARARRPRRGSRGAPRCRPAAARRTRRALLLWVTAAQLLLDLVAQDSARDLERRRLRRNFRPSLLTCDVMGYLSYDHRNADHGDLKAGRRRPGSEATGKPRIHADPVSANSGNNAPGEGTAERTEACRTGYARR